MSTHVATRRMAVLSACLPLILTLAAPQEVRGQVLQGSITGNVTDTSGAAVPGAKVVATEQQTNFTRDTTTNTAGVYNLPTMPPGTYTITIGAASFQTTSVTGVIVSPQEVTRRDVTLVVGQVNQTIEVQAEAVALQTDRADVREDVTSNLLENVPVPIGRNYENLFITLPGVSPPTNANSFTANAQRGLTFVVGGGLSGYNRIRVDGTGTFDMTANAEAQYTPALEAIEQVSISGNSMDAEQSAGGGAIDLTVKSGTNAIHGVLFEDHTDQHIEAYPWAANRSLPNPRYINNQYGGTIGGPIKKNKWFYFLSYEGTGLIATAPFLAEVPTAQMRTGNLSGNPDPIYDPFTGNSTNGLGRTPFPGNIIPASMITPGVQNLLNYSAANGNLWSLPNQPGTGSLGLANNLNTNGETYLERHQTDFKTNWNPTSKLSTFVRFGWGNNYWTTPTQFGILGGPGLSNTNTAQGYGGTSVYSGTISATYIISPSLIFDAHYGYDVNSAFSVQPGATQNLGWTIMQIPGLNTAGEPVSEQKAKGGLPAIVFDTGFSQLGSVSKFQPQDYWDPEKNVDANLTWIKGAHNLRFGFDSDFQNSRETQWESTGAGTISGAGGFEFQQQNTELCLAANAAGVCTSNSPGNEYNSFASFLLGVVNNGGAIYQQSPSYYTDTKYYAGYARDQWQVNSRLTVSIGLRFEFFPIPLRNGTGAEYYDIATNNMQICGLGGVPSSCGIFNHSQWHPAPRVGVAYRIGDKTVIRAGYGIATDPTNLFALSERRINFPYIDSYVLDPPQTNAYITTLAQGITPPPNPLPPPASGAIPVPGTVGLFTNDPGDWTRGYVETYNFTIEERIRTGWTASVGYVGSKQIDPMVYQDENWSPIGTGTAGQQLNTPGVNGEPLTGFSPGGTGGRIATTARLQTFGTTNYNSLQARTNARIGAVAFNLGYTLGKNLGWIAPGGTTGGSAIPSSYSYNYGPIPQLDIKNNFEATAIYALPFGKGQQWLSTGMASNILGGWQLSGVFSDFSGRPFSVTANNNLNAVSSYQFANCIAPPQKVGNLLEWYNPDTFAAPSSAGFGDCGMGVLRGPGLVNGDVGLEKKFAVRDRFIFAFRTEMYNVGNTPHHASPGYGPSTGTNSNNNVQNSAFMEILPIANTGRDGIDQRTVKFSLKMTF
jgi:Carboxypeptidase regulatory-like domain/TonB dependent receptor